MAIKGTLESFAVAEIFQLISHQRKTGTLEIRTEEGVAKLRFLDGTLVEAWPDRRSPSDYIGSLLVRAALVSGAQVEQALESQRQSLRRLGDILVRMGAIRASDFQEVLALQHRETAYRVLRLKRGEFEFVPGLVEPEEGASVSLDVDAVLMEGCRQIDEWPSLVELVPSEKQVYAPIPEAPVDRGLSPDDSRVLALVDGTRTVREVVDRSRLGEFLGWKAFASLVEQGLVLQVGASRKPAPHLTPVRPRRTADGMTALGFLVLAALLLALFAPHGLREFARLRDAVLEAREEASVLSRRASEWRERRPVVWPGERDSAVDPDR